MRKKVLIYVVCIGILLSGCTFKKANVDPTDDITIEEEKVGKEVSESFYHNKSKFTISATIVDNNMKMNLTYDAQDEAEAITAYYSMCHYMNNIVNIANKQDLKGEVVLESVSVYLPDSRYIYGTSLTPLMATENDGEIISGELPDWYDLEKVDIKGEIGTFIFDSIIESLK